MAAKHWLTAQSDGLTCALLRVMTAVHWVPAQRVMGCLCAGLRVMDAVHWVTPKDWLVACVLS